MGEIGTLFEAILFIIVFGSILFLAYVASRYIAGKTIKARKGRYMEIIETIVLGADKKLHLIRVNKQFILMASCGKNMEFIANVPLEGYETIDDADEKSEAFNFKSFFNKSLEIYRNFKKESFFLKNKGQIMNNEKVANYFKENLDRLRALNEDRSMKNDKDEKSDGC